MNNSPVLKLQEMASSNSTDIEDLLLRAKMISVKLGLKDISDWIEHELNAYPNVASLPDYRIITDIPIGAFNPYHGWTPYQFSSGFDAETYELLTTVHITNPVSMLVQYSKSENSLYCDVPQAALELLQTLSGSSFRMAWCITPSIITKIISNTRSRILDWSLSLENRGIFGEGLLFSQAEKREAAEMTVNNINNFNGNVHNAGAIGAGNTGDIHQQNSITSGNFNSLERQLKEHGLDDTDVTELEQLVKQTSKPTTKDGVEKEFGAWIGKITGKAFTGGLKIAGTAAPALLTNAICHYFGIPV
ncbi:abortive phage resistance protein [Dickeya chrysanthemi]|uniref:AbiTii domain-containing protein n=1 Tax=Dickeya chrysanthemi TaxID=556 RepID=UPI0025A14147|nr:abortive phage resistance protein [Dickeya chrysanthemi]WJM84751.1 abortive phage resistance protein [Dickeya chrysanthemi]